MILTSETAPLRISISKQIIFSSRPQLLQDSIDFCNCISEAKKLSYTLLSTLDITIDSTWRALQQFVIISESHRITLLASSRDPTSIWTSKIRVSKGWA